MNVERTVPIMVIRGNSIAVCLYIILLITGVLVHLYGQQTDAGANATVMVPNEAIRLRILANSDNVADQELKRKVRDAVNAQINDWVAELTSFEEAKRVIRSHLPDIEQTVARVLRDEQSNQSYKVEFGSVRFPTKVYGNYVYPAGTYDAVLITLGAGKGANWWCVLFPPLCFLDFSNGDAVMMREKEMPANENEADKPAPTEADASMKEKRSKKEAAQPDGQEDESIAIAIGEETERHTVAEEINEDSVSTSVSDGNRAVDDTSLAAIDIGEDASEEEQMDSGNASPVVMAESEQRIEVKFFFKELLAHLIP
ncbi:stage II sporulation protein R [Geobacillus thermodenitrificans]|uniref:stage II sporulation protein R n=1 Tax=Geobacillus thermodenitrificans TaxID=33940 RepID=UPI000C05BFF3|nr:stage II sporulation protein R [Geobacillus thermodenitrificans]